jgi:hypothetical protein
MAVTSPLQVALLVLLTGQHLQATFIGYDCDNPQEVSVLDTNAVENCQKPEKNGYASKEIQAVLIQSKTATVITVYACTLTFIQSIFTCTFNEHSSAPINTVADGVDYISRERCMQAHKYGTMTLYKKEIDDLKESTARKETVTVAGARDNVGSCSYNQYTFRGTDYNYVTVERSYTITLKTIKATAKLDTNQLTFPDGSRCTVTEEECINGDTRFFWTTAPTECKETEFAEVFRGTISIVTRPSESSKLITYAVAKSNTHILALQIRGNVSVCGHTAFATEHAQVFIAPTENTIISKFSKLTKHDINNFVYLNAKFLFTEITETDRLQDLATAAVYKRCQIQRQLLINRLALIKTQPELISLLLSKPGHIAKTVGEGLYIVKCTPTQVRLFKDDKCYNELRVLTEHNETRWLQPTTKILLKRGEEIACTSAAPSIHRINGQWWAINPEPHVIPAPPMLAPDQEISPVYKVIDTISSAGFYTSDDVKKLSDLLLFGVEQKAVTSIITRSAAGDSIASVQLDNMALFTVERTKAWFNKAFSYLFGWITDFGLFVSFLLGLVATIRILKFIIGTIINALALKELFGCSKYMAAAFCTPLVNLLLARQQTTQLDVEQGLAPPRPDNNSTNNDPPATPPQPNRPEARRNPLEMPVPNIACRPEIPVRQYPRLNMDDLLLGAPRWSRRTTPPPQYCRDS